VLVQRGCDISIGSRFIAEEGQEIPRWRADVVKLINSLMDNGDRLGVTALETLTVIEDHMEQAPRPSLKAQENGLKICEVPIKVRYHEGSWTHNPIVYAVSVVLSTLKHLSINKPLTFYGIPGITSMLISLIFWGWTFRIFLQTRGIITNIASSP